MTAKYLLTITTIIIHFLTGDCALNESLLESNLPGPIELFAWSVMKCQQKIKSKNETYPLCYDLVHRICSQWLPSNIYLQKQPWMTSSFSSKAKQQLLSWDSWQCTQCGVVHKTDGMKQLQIHPIATTLESNNFMDHQCISDAMPLSLSWTIHIKIPVIDGMDTKGDEIIIAVLTDRADGFWNPIRIVRKKKSLLYTSNSYTMQLEHEENDYYQVDISMNVNVDEHSGITRLEKIVSNGNHTIRGFHSKKYKAKHVQYAVHAHSANKTKPIQYQLSLIDYKNHALK